MFFVVILAINHYYIMFKLRILLNSVNNNRIEIVKEREIERSVESFLFINRWDLQKIVFFCTGHHSGSFENSLNEKKKKKKRKKYILKHDYIEKVAKTRYYKAIWGEIETKKLQDLHEISYFVFCLRKASKIEKYYLFLWEQFCFLKQK